MLWADRCNPADPLAAGLQLTHWRRTHPSAVSGGASRNSGQSAFRTAKLAATPASRKEVMSFGIYIGGYLIVIGGLVYGAVMLHVPSQWIVVGAVVLGGLGILTGVKATRQKE